jgi:transposase InsO family protein
MAVLRKSRSHLDDADLPSASNPATVPNEAPISSSSARPPTRPVYSVPNSSAKTTKRMSSYDLKRMFGCRTLKDWRMLEQTGDGLQVYHEGTPPLSIGDMATITRNRHGKLLTRPAQALHTVGMDIGYGEGTSPGGYKYALTLVDLATRHTWVYGLRTKSAESIIDVLWSFLVDAGSIPHRIRCDFDSSFVKGQVYSFLRRKGIRTGASPPGRQSQNVAVERQWRTTTSMARALLVEARLPKRYWFWALREAVIRMNLLPCRPGTTQAPQQSEAGEFEDFASPPARAATDTKTLRGGPLTAQLTTPFELFYGVEPDYRTLFQWGCLGYYRRVRDSSGRRGQFDMYSSVGVVLGRSNHTNGMIFGDLVTQRMNVSADYRLDPSAAIGTHFPNVIYDGQISPLVLRGGKNSNKEPFPPGSAVQANIKGEFLQGIVSSVPIEPNLPNYHVLFPDSPDYVEIPLNQLSALDEPVFTLVDADTAETTNDTLPSLPDWIKDSTQCSITHDGA